MIIRRFREDDAQAVSDLIVTTLRVTNTRDYPADMIEALAAAETPADILRRAGWTHFYVAEEDGALVGCGAIGPYWGSLTESSLFSIFVHPDRQGRGVGRRIVEALERDEYALRARRIEVPASITGLPFYLRLGYDFRNGNDAPDAERLYRLEKFPLPPERQALLDLIRSRRSYRGEFRPDPVPRQHLRAILEAGLAAPSGCNKQTASLIAVDDPAVLEKLRAVIRPPVGETAPAAICVLTRRIIAYRDRCFAVQDYAAAIENMLLAVEALGYRSCWYEGHITDADRIGDRMAEILGVPEGYELVCFLPVGLAEETPAAPKKKPFEARASFNTFAMNSEASEE